MWHYRAPLRDLRYVIDELLDLPAQWAAMPAFAELDAATARQVIDEAARFATEVVAPLNARGDLDGCTWRDGEVRTPAGFATAYRAFVAAGWPALPYDPADGGQGLPGGMPIPRYPLPAPNSGGVLPTQESLLPQTNDMPTGETLRTPIPDGVPLRLPEP